MNSLIPVLRLLLGLFLAFVGCITLLIAPWQLADLNFSFASSWPLLCISLVLGSVMLWAAWRLVRGSRVPAHVGAPGR